MLLLEVAEIFQGITNRLTGQKKMNYIKVKRLNSLTPLGWEWFEIVKGKPLPSRHYLQQNDILLTSVIHNKKMKAVIYDLPDSDVICQANTLVIRLNSSDFLAEFLLIYLNHFAVEKLRLTGHKNPTIHKISVSALKQLEFPNCSINEQHRIVQLYDLYSCIINDLQAKLQETEKARLESVKRYF